MNIHAQSAIAMGGGSGLGAETARELTRRGAKLEVLDINGEAAAVVAEIGDVAARCDIADTASVWIDLSGWSPKYFSAQLVHYANTLLKDRILFGSDYPLITPDRWMTDFAHAGFKLEVQPGILEGNAMRLLGRGEHAAT